MKERTAENIRRSIKEHLEKICDVTPEPFVPGLKLRDHIDSLDEINLICELERDYNARIPDERIDHIKTVDDLTEAIINYGDTDND